MRISTLTALALAAAAFAPAVSAQEKPSAPKAAGKDWTDHMGDIPFILGRQAGLKEAEFTGRPIFYFYTATW